MKKENFDKLVNKRINKDSEILNNKIEKEKQTISYLYKTILSEFAEEIEKNIESYNDTLNKYYKNLSLFLYYGESYGKKSENYYQNSIMIIFNNKNEKEPKFQTLKTNFNHFSIKIEHNPGLAENEYFYANYFISTDHAVYEMTKAAVDALTRNVAVAYGPFGIRANAVAPGAIMTPALEKSFVDAPDPVARRQSLELLTPMKRIGQPSEIAEVVAFLLSTRASYLSGQSVGVEGAWTSALGVPEIDIELAKRYGLDHKTGLPKS
jgi:hypothetical protein